MSACNKCGCDPCGCSPSVLASPQIIGGVIDGATVNGPTINGGQSNNLNLVGAQIDCTSRVCTQPPGICDNSIASTSFVCTAIANAISSLNPAFCAAVQDCLLADTGVFCPIVANCINTTPGIINTTNAFGIGSRATTTAYGVVALADRGDIDNLSCNLAIEPCALAELFCAPNIVSPFWNCFQNAVNVALFGLGGDLCTAVDACGFARLNSPVFTGIPQAPTAAAGTATDQIATTAFVQNQIGATVPGLISSALAAAISSGNPAFCAAVAGCGGGGGGGFTVIGHGSANFLVTGGGLFQSANYAVGGTITAGTAGIPARFTFAVPQPDANYSVALAMIFPGSLLWSMEAVVSIKTTSFFEFNIAFADTGAAFGATIDVIAVR